MLRRISFSQILFFIGSLLLSSNAFIYCGSLEKIEEESLPIQTKLLEPILNNYITIYCPKEKKKKFFTVSQVLHTFLLELKKNNLFPSVSIGGSSITNQCVAPVNMECNDIDVKLIFDIDKEPLESFFPQIDQLFITCLNQLLDTENSSYNKLEDFQIQNRDIYFSEIFSVQLPRKLYILPSAFNYIPPSSTPSYIIKAFDYVPLEFLVMVVNTKDKKQFSLSEFIAYGNTSDSFFVKVDLFENTLGTLGPNLYRLSSAEGKCKKNIELVNQGIYRFGSKQDETHRGCVRFFMKLTEGFSDPFLQKSEFGSIKHLVIDDTICKFRKFIEYKRTISEYYLFCLINGFFSILLNENPYDLANIFFPEIIHVFKELNASPLADSWIRCMTLCSAHLKAGTTATTENEPSALVNGVNVITGDFYLVEKDMTIQGAEPIHLQRHYISQKGDGYWNMFSYHRAFVDFHSQVIEIIEPSGARLFYRWESKYDRKGKAVKTFYSMDPSEENSKGLTNTARGTLSGKTNLKNQNIHMSSNSDKLSVTCPDGTKRTYEIERHFDVEEFMDWNTSSLPSHRKSFLLVKEELPTTRQIRYEWPRNKKDVWKIETCDKDKKIVYAWAKFYPHNGRNPKTGKKDVSHGDYGVETSDGRHLEYSFFTHNKVHQLKAVHSDDKPDQTYQYLSYNKKKLLKSIILPEGRFLNINYYTPNDSIGEKDPVCFRVKELVAPAGENGSSIATHRFLYDLNNKKTTLLDPYDVPTDYYWNDDLRLTQINYFTKPGSLYKQERFIWGNNNSKEASNLLCKVTCDEKENPLFAIRYYYDSYGNVEKETFYGNLSGIGSPIHLDSEGFPIEDGVESYSQRSVHSTDGKNLLLSQSADNGLSISYTYFRNTSLVANEIVKAHDIPQKEKSYGYDPDHGVLYQDSTKDLQGNLHVILDIFPKSGYAPEKEKNGSEYRYPKLPSKIEECYQKGNSKEIITQTKLLYTKGGQLSQKRVFVANPSQELRFSQYSYQEGCLVSETDFYGRKSESTYDALHNLKSRKDFGGRSQTEIEYDLMNRPTLSKEGGEGVSRIHHCKYNNRGQKIEAYDTYGNKTSYEYDAFGNTLKTILPSGGVIVAEYDASGNMTSLTDPKGHTTKTFYNAYNKPIQVVYPNGVSEKFIYNKEGTLQIHIDKEGMETHFTYDVFGRVLSKKTPFSEETKTYDSFNVLSETDAEGRTISYEYDEGGRKILERNGEEVVRYSYDRLGRVHHTRLGDLSIITEYDPLDQVVQERKCDLQGNVLQIIDFIYDSDGNLVSTEKEINPGEKVKDVTGYDALKRVTYRQDPEGHITKYEYDDRNHKQIAQDPLGLKTVQTFNADNKIASLEKYSPQKDLIIQEFYSYDLNQNLIQKESITSNLSTKTRWEYNEVGELILLVEGSGSPEEKRTEYSYTPKGLLYQTTKPSGVTLTNIYAPLGYLNEQFSSDGSIHYTYVHDLTGLLKQSADEITGSSFFRSYTVQGRLEEETLPSGLSFKNAYDLQGRRTLLTLPDESSILYNYDCLYLRAVSKIKENKTLYTHKYTAYDPSGNLRYEMPIANLFPTTHQYDDLGRHIGILSTYFSERVITFDAVGNLLAKNRNREFIPYSYDSLYQLVSETSHTYQYDAHHNRLGKDNAIFTSNQLNQTSELVYNSDGNPIAYEGKKLSYDALDRLICVQDSTQKTLYSYDSFHRRLSKKIYENNSLITDISYLYDDQNEIGAFDNLSNQIIELRVLGNAPHAEIGAAIALELYGKTYMPIHDLQGNIATLVLTRDGSLERFSYTAFGEESNVSLNPWRFSSKRLDPETGFVYFGRRYYLPSLGRWLTPDPLGLEAGSNLYAFVSNSPLTHFDLYGLFSISFKQPESPEYIESLPNSAPFVNQKEPYIPEQNYTVGSKEIPGCFTLFTNGIQTKLGEAKDYAKLISKYGGEMLVHGTYNPTKNLFADGAKAFLGILGMQKQPSNFVAEQCNEFLSRHLKGSQKALIICHSDGATHVYNYLKNLQRKDQLRFIVLAIAPASIIPRSMCFNSYNYMSKRDLISLARPVVSQLIRGSWDYFSRGASLKHFDELEFVSPHPDAKWFDHSFNSPTFTDLLKKHISEYIQTGTRR